MTSGRFTEIPIVDLAAVDGDDALVEEVREICHEVGFFVVVNHGVDDELVTDVFEMMQRFFELPESHKRLIDKRNSRHFRGWEPVGAESTNNRPDIREQIDLWSEWPARAADVEPSYLRLLGPNQWLPDDVLPGHRDLVSRWFDELGALADRIMTILCVGLGLSADHLSDYFGVEPMSLTKLISYPPTPTGQAGVNAHHDTGFLTVLAAGSTAGLQVENTDGAWIDVPLVPDSFVINLGEMLQAITGNYFVATPHRVITRGPRLSAGYFHGPSLDTRLDPLPLDSRFAAAVSASARHRGAGFMAGRDETDAGVGDMQSTHRPDVYGEQLWNYFARSYPENMSLHYPT
ncbi:MAG: 2-oxoglutarate and iron-dependent oxygenase domain-containing protein [Ilumatobacteraceae bacterium]